MFFWTARVFSAVSFQICGVAVGWQIYALTGRAMDLGLVGLAQFLPMVLLTLAAGNLADRYDRRMIARTCQFIQGITMAWLCTGTIVGWIHSTGIFIAVALMGAARSFENPTMSALLAGLVPPELLPKASAFSSSAIQTAYIIGPALGGFLYAFGPAVPYGVAAALFILAAICSAFIRLERAMIPSPERGWKAFFSGIGFIRSHKVILGSISLDLFAVLFGGATALLPIYARDILHTGPVGLGLLRSAPAVGALIMAVTLTRYPLRNRIGRIMFCAVIFFGAATIVFGLSTSMPLSLAALATLGAADVFSMVIRSTLVQTLTPDGMRGRVSAVNFLFIGTSNQLGEFESGVTAAFWGAVPAVVAGGIGTIVVAFLWMRFFPELRNTDEFPT